MKNVLLGSHVQTTWNLKENLESKEQVEDNVSPYDLGATQLIHNSQLDIYNTAHKTRRTGIICTIGPASQSVEMMQKLIEVGMNVVRMNFSHGTHQYHATTAENARAAAHKLGIEICIALDTKGPEIRTGNFENDKVYVLELGKKVRVTTNDQYMNKGTAEQFYVDYKNITNVVKKVTLCMWMMGWVNLPNVPVDLPALSEQDRKDLAFGVKQKVDMIFASFIRSAEDVIGIRKELVSHDKEVGGRIMIIAKIENHQGMQHFDKILDVADGVMVARGDLGIEIPVQKVFLAQKMMVSKCNMKGKPVIVATQMLESMITNPRPTRAEVSDVANAVLDGADCVMLSAESAKGKYPIEAVTMMANICREAETARNSYEYFLQVSQSLKKPLGIPDTVALSAVQSCFEQQSQTMIVLTNSGTTARLVAKFRPPCPVIAVVGNTYSHTLRQLAITAGVYPIGYDDKQGKQSADDRIELAISYAKKRQWAKTGGYIVAVHADKLNTGFANLIRILTVP
ncbi:hypothetical protein RFI_18497 [Reticulomyxa filosa]|uniref:Pyruvate kinase n=1 Tax=Reticulomyxa filosa TaxID=46433 RepID=X6MYP8_RETFI|nr:hypothetical protein RFI_18497 [Reticulomyxa filosa]|eukprot:ETO18758.1 hypothetical protein RFI_18497 [Reticulomyxa filosa]